VIPEAGPDERLETVAEIWATVDLEGALRELGRGSNLAGEAAAESAVTDPHLGARVALIAGGAGELLALAEPTTEGRLAASLARRGEGPAGRYASLPDGDTLEAYRRRAHASGLTISRVQPGPFGPSVLVAGGPLAGPHLIVVERRSLPSRP
jgi:hypothetical protein